MTDNSGKNKNNDKDIRKSSAEKDIKESFETLLEGQRSFFRSGATRPVSFRVERLKKLRDMISENENHILAAMKQDLGKNPFEAYLSEIVPVLQEIDFALKNIDRWTKTEKVKTPLIQFPSSSYIYPEPYGVVLIIGPWNYPFQLLFAPLVGAVAAGNCAVLKPSQYAPATTELTARLVKDYLSEDYIAVVSGGDMSRKLLEEEFDYIFFTGSTKVGRLVMKAAAEHLTPVTLELGGKSPCIVDQSADIGHAAAKIVWGKFINAGQTCVAPEYVYVHKSVKAELMEAIKNNIKKFYGNDPGKSPDYGRIINNKNFRRLISLIERERIFYGGDYSEEELYIGPTIMENITWDEPVMEEEIFGPLLPVMAYESIEEVIEGVRKFTKPLALYIFTAESEREEKIIGQLSFGGGCVNDVIMHLLSPNLPFGGVGASGMGAYHGKRSFDTFTHYKSILKNSPKHDFKTLAFPPYKEKLLPVLKKALRI